MTKFKVKKTWKARAIVLTLLLIGAALRLWEWGRIPAGLYHDEAQHGIDALNVLDGELAFYFTANNGREPLHIYLVTACVGLLGRSPLAVRLPSFFIGFLTLAATYDLARVLWNRRVARWALAVLTVTFWHVHLSRVSFRAVLLPLFTALTLAQAVRALRTQRRRHWIAAGALYGLSWYSYMAARFTPLALAVLILYGLISHREVVKRAWRGALLFCVAALIILAPLGLYTVRHPDVVLSRSGQVSVFSEEINAGDPWGTLARHTLRTLGMFFVRGDRIWRHNLAWRPVWDIGLGLAFVIGLGVVLVRISMPNRTHPHRDASSALVLLWTVVMMAPTLLAEDAPHFLRGVGVLPTAALIPAMGLAWIEDRFRPLGKAKFGTILAVLLWYLGLISTGYDYFVKFANAPLAYHWFEAGQVELAGTINALLGNGWEGQRMQHGEDKDRTITIDRQLWNSWTAMPFLVPETSVRFFPASSPKLNDGLAFIVWPYRDWQPDVLPHLPHPAYLNIQEGPQIQGDKDPQPFMVAWIVRAEPHPEIPAPIAQFENGIALRAALVTPGNGDVKVQLWWDAEIAPDASYTVFVHYLRDGERIAQHDALPGYGHLSTVLWQAGDLILDTHQLTGLIPDPSRDHLRVGLYHSERGEGVAILDRAGNPAGDWFDFPVILSVSAK